MPNIFETLKNTELNKNEIEEKSSKKMVTESENKKTGFAALDNNFEIGIKFDDKKITVYRQGKNINIQDWINKGNNEVTIYQVLQKYHGDLKLTQEELNHNATRLSDAFAEIGSLKDVYDIQKKSKQEWDNLPLSIRQEFGHDQKRFLNEGANWARNKIKEYQENIAKKAEEEKKEVNNG